MLTWPEKNKNNLHATCKFDGISHLKNSPGSSLMRHLRVILDRILHVTSSEDVPILSILKYFLVVSGTSCSFLINVKTRRSHGNSESKNKIWAKNWLMVFYFKPTNQILSPDIFHQNWRGSGHWLCLIFL